MNSFTRFRRDLVARTNALFHRMLELDARAVELWTKVETSGRTPEVYSEANKLASWEFELFGNCDCSSQLFDALKLDEERLELDFFAAREEQG